MFLIGGISKFFLLTSSKDQSSVNFQEMTQSKKPSDHVTIGLKPDWTGIFAFGEQKHRMKCVKAYKARTEC